MAGSHEKSISEAFSLKTMLLAWLKFAPRIPKFLAANIELLSKRKHHKGSTGFLLQKQAERRPNKTFLKFETQYHTYQQVNESANQLAHYLKQQGVKKGDAVAVMFENSPEQLITIFAINKLGAIAALMNYKQRGEVLKHSLDTVKPVAVIVGQNSIDNFQSVKTLLTADERYNQVKHYWIKEDAWRRGCEKKSLGCKLPEGFVDIVTSAQECPVINLAETEQIELGSHCFYVMTSGTTGLPKAAAMTHLRWYKAGLAFGKMALGLKRNDIQYCCLPFYHNTALSIALSSTLVCGTTLAIGRKFSASSFWTDIQRHKATSFTYIGELCRYLLNQPIQENEREHLVRSVIGNGLRTELWDEFQERFQISHVYELYGASEGNIGFVNVFNLKRTVGFSPLRFKVVRFDLTTDSPVTDEFGRLQEVRKGEVGLLLAEVSAKSPFDGYTHNQAANDAKLIKNAFKKGDCWFNSGDLVRQQGFRHVAFIDRVGDTFRWKSENVATTEVEAYIQRVQGILEAVVYGVKVPHAEGKAGMASLVVEPSSPFDPKAFYETIRSYLPDYAVPLFIRLCGDHEKTGTFKVVKTHLKAKGFHVLEAQEPVYVLVDRNVGYQPLTPKIFKKIEAGDIRF